MRFRVILFDLDGTLIDSGPIIVASMRHASVTVLGQEPDEDRVKAAIGGQGLIAQMRDLDPDRVDELIEVYRAHNEPLHSTLEAFDGIPELRVELQRRGHQPRWSSRLPACRFSASSPMCSSAPRTPSGTSPIPIRC